MAKRVDKSRFDLKELGFRRNEDEFLERLVLPTDTLQGIALLYNTTVAELKRVNHIGSESELHARRVIKVPSKGILVDLTEDVAKPSSKTDVGGTSASINLDVVSDESDQENNGQVYLNNVDSVIKEIKVKAEVAAAKSPILNGSDSPMLSRKDFVRNKGELKWWMLLLPCLAVLIAFPVLYFLYREQVVEPYHDHDDHHNHNHEIKNSSNT